MALPFEFKSLVDGLGDAVMVTDREGRVVYWNVASERIFGFSADEIVGQSLDKIIPARQQARHWEGYHKTMDSGITRYGTTLLRVPAVHKAGHTLSIAFTVSLLKDSQGAVTHITAVVRDDTERFLEDRALKQKLAALEAQKLSES